jgi:Protein of unknown function (DUF3179)
MKRMFWLGCIGLFLFEIANVYFIMPMPGSQRMNSIDTAYFLYKWRWIFRSLFGLMIIAGLFKSNWKRKWIPAIPLLLIVVIAYMANFKMAADAMFKQPSQLQYVTADKSKVDSNRLVIGVVINGEAKAYPIQFLGYHHQVQDVVGGKAVLVTYCTVCRTGRVFEPIVNGKKETFRLVGMDHFNAMLEDATTKSWWRQATGEAITGKLKGKKLPEVFSTQTTLTQWLLFNPGSKVMQADSAFTNSYTKSTKYEDGTSRDDLTGTDSLSWKDKSWVVGIKAGNETKAYDWNVLKTKRLIADNIGEIPILLVLATDNKSFFAFERPDYKNAFFVQGDTLLYAKRLFTINGKGIDTTYSLKPLPAYQEFWHSWKTFNPKTQHY